MAGGATRTSSRKGQGDRLGPERAGRRHEYGHRHPHQISAGAISGSYANPQASTSQDVEAYIGPAYGQNPNSGLSGTINVGKGAVTVNALSPQEPGDRQRDQHQGRRPDVVLHAPSGDDRRLDARRHIGGTFSITAGAVNVTGSSTNPRPPT